MPTIDFSTIRIHNGSQAGGFEELCAQLARADAQSVGQSFVRKGVGGDSGVECFAIRSDATETGWQAKYVFAWSSSLKQQLDGSIEAALAGHPGLTDYIVCLPFDLSDGRKPDQESARDKWVSWCKYWQAKVAPRPLSIHLWDKSSIVARLIRPEPAMAGRLLYWFERDSLTPSWFAARLAIAKAALGTRYVPEDHIELDLARTFRAFAHRDELSKDLARHTNRIMTAYGKVLDASAKATPDSVANLKSAMSALSDLIENRTIQPQTFLPLGEWTSALEASRVAAKRVLSSIPEGSDLPARRKLVDDLLQLDSVLADFLVDLDQSHWRAWNATCIFLTGEAGVGKSHLLGDFVEHQLAIGQPALLLLGSQFTDDEPWRQVMILADFTQTQTVSTFLAAIDAAAECAGGRAIICVDALNERNGLDIWPSRISSFLAAAAHFPRLCIVLSCRSTFADLVRTEIASVPGTLEVYHEGFADGDGHAARAYLAKRGIVYPGAPNISPELNNPLFLRTLCVLLEQQGRKALPRGSQGVAAMFDMYLEGACEAVRKRMGLSPPKRVPQRAVAALVNEMIQLGQSYIPHADATRIVEAIHPSGNRAESDLLAALHQEGVVDNELDYSKDAEPTGVTRFTFERFSDHRIASTIIGGFEHIDAARTFFSDADNLKRYVTKFASRGIASAMAIQLPEKFGVEILDLIEDPSLARRAVIPFCESLLWRDQSKFTDRTMQLVERHLELDEQLDLKVAISTEPDNKFNARFLLDVLGPMAMPDRDLTWSVPVASFGYDGHIKTLIDWVFANGFSDMEDARAELAAIVLVQLTSTSHRVVRDRATTALAVLLSSRLELAQRLVERHRNVNDPYVRERLYAGVYGAVLQRADERGLGELARLVFEVEFAQGAPTPNILVRDYAAGIVEQAAARGVLPAGIDSDRARPPFKTSWRPKPVLEAEIEKYTETYGETHVFRDSIVASVIDGDFGRYVVDGAIDDFSLTDLGSPPATMRTQFELWEARFLGAASADSLNAYKAFKAAAKKAVDVSSWEKDPRRAAFDETQKAFRTSLTEEEWETYRTEAANFLEVWLFAKRQSNDLPRRTDIVWAYRWICRRAHELGWSAERFSKIDRALSSGGRHDHDVERVGKKYQWLALYELVAHLGDTKNFIGGYRGDDTPQKFRGAAQIGLRNIDPSLLVRNTFYEGWKQWDATWWSPLTPVLKPTDALGRLAWRDADVDVLNDQCLFDVKDPATGREYLCLHSFARWHSGGSGATRDEQYRDSWYRVFCLVVKKQDEAKLLQYLRDTSLVSPENEKKVDVDSGFIGEFPWEGLRGEEDDWIEPTWSRGPPVPVLPVVSEYLRERASFDHAIDRNVSVMLPAPWLATAMDLRMTGGRSLGFTNPAGTAEFFDPSVRAPGPSAALISKAAFLAHLDQHDLAAVWVVAGEKGVYSGRDHEGWGGRLVHSTVYERNGHSFVAHRWRMTELPSRDQLRAYFKGETLPEGVTLESIIQLYQTRDSVQLHPDDLLGINESAAEDGEGGGS